MLALVAQARPENIKRIDGETCRIDQVREDLMIHVIHHRHRPSLQHWNQALTANLTYHLFDLHKYIVFFYFASFS